MSDLDTLTRTSLHDIAAADALDALDAIRVRLLGKSGAITEQLKQLGKLPPDERKARGEAINVAKQQVQDAIAARKSTLEEADFERRLSGERIDARTALAWGLGRLLRALVLPDLLP